MTKDDARKWMEGWTALEARERDLLQSESPEGKLRALAFLMASVDLFNLEGLEGEDDIARARWLRLKVLMLDR